MTTKETVRRYFEALQAGSGWEELLADRMVFTNFGAPVREVSGKGSFLAATSGFYSMIGSLEVRDLMVDGERACALTRYALQPPGGPGFTSDVAEVFEVRNGRITRFGIYFDSAPYPK